MRTQRLWTAFFLILIPALTWAQDGKEGLQLDFKVQPLAAGFRYDDNVYRAVEISERWADEIYSLNGGAQLRSTSGIVTGELGYRLGMDRYLEYTDLNNFKHDFILAFGVNPEDWNFSYSNEFFARSSLSPDFNYQDDDNFFGAQWTPKGPWSYEASYKNSYRQYYDLADSYQSRNFTDQAVWLGIQREIDDRFSMKLEAGYTDRQFNRNAVTQFAPLLGTIQSDETWAVKLNAHAYLESILNDFTLEHARTLSNSYGFTNSVYSFSWAAVVRPAASFYLELFLRLFYKTYDENPLVVPDLQLGFIDEDGEGLLSAKGSWDFAPQWTAGLSVSRVRNENTQPGAYYIKNIVSFQVRRSF